MFWKCSFRSAAYVQKRTKLLCTSCRDQRSNVQIVGSAQLGTEDELSAEAADSVYSHCGAHMDDS